jgi:CubicO group peptidase (beta-lactamase class C family)
MNLDRTLATLTLGIIFTAASLAQIAPPADLDAWVARSMQSFEVPGLSLAIVKDGKVVVAKGYGVRKLGDATPVDENTLFGIGSNTKAFTVACLAMLVDEGKIAWDDPVYQRLPAFQMFDPDPLVRPAPKRGARRRSQIVNLGVGAALDFQPDRFGPSRDQENFEPVRLAVLQQDALSWDIQRRHS